jgi:hypothetical protein
VPLIVAERRSNSIVLYASKQDTSAIRRLIEKLDVDLYGGRRVFIYFNENTKAKDLAATLDAIYGRGERPATSQGPRGTTGSEQYRTGAVPPVTVPTPSPRPVGTGLTGTLAGEGGPAAGYPVHCRRGPNAIIDHVRGSEIRRRSTARSHA